jgi:hypothetical protein
MRWCRSRGRSRMFLGATAWAAMSCTPATGPVVRLEVAPKLLDFGDVDIGSGAQATVALRNTGEARRGSACIYRTYPMVCSWCRRGRIRWT